MWLLHDSASSFHYTVNIGLEKHLIHFPNELTLLLVINEFVVTGIVADSQDCVIASPESRNAPSPTGHLDFAEAPFRLQVLWQQFVGSRAKKIGCWGDERRGLVLGRVFSCEQVNCAVAGWDADQAGVGAREKNKCYLFSIQDLFLFPLPEVNWVDCGSLSSPPELR